MAKVDKSLDWLDSDECYESLKQSNEYLSCLCVRSFHMCPIIYSLRPSYYVKSHYAQSAALFYNNQSGNYTSSQFIVFQSLRKLFVHDSFQNFAMINFKIMDLYFPEFTFPFPYLPVFSFFCTKLFHNSLARTNTVSMMKWIQVYGFRNTQGLE